MKKVLITLLITGLVFSAQVYAQQGKGSDKPPKPPKPQPVKVKTPPVPKPAVGQPPKPVVPVKPGEPQTPVKPQNPQGKDKTKGEVKDKENQGKGNAYGKNKEGLEGKEFGQHRAAEAKSKQEAVSNSKQSINSTTKTN
ncbi:MAG TPA: hypothetical protein PLB59_03975, partial [Bacteroidales bacterium]|nr:hypothetical protein [Bacteroidales bacterium]HQN15591.1 hypothetical protein [Bacteroidales bacterium]HQP15104.1 hypothetical protein [Bacteroidales bacterium]